MEEMGEVVENILGDEGVIDVLSWILWIYI